MNTATKPIPRNRPLPCARGVIIPCNDNIHVEIHAAGSFVSTTERTESFTEVLEAKFYIDAYYDQMAALNGLPPIGGNNHAR